MKLPTIAFLLLCLSTRALSQEIDEPIISPRFEYGPGFLGLRGIFIAYASGAVEGGYYYMLSTNAYHHEPPSALPNGECIYYDLVTQKDVRIGEQVVGYRGANTFAALHAFVWVAPEMPAG
jgi:hypothetical protein